VLGG
jgi:hypothetical protein